MPTPRNLNQILKHPSTTLLIGDTGQGKTAGMAACMEWFRDQKVEVFLADKPKLYPKWVHNISLKNVELKSENSVLCIDDAHNYFYAGLEEDRDDLKALDLINRARRHGGKRSVVYNTQMSGALSRKLIGMTTFCIFKKSSPMQIEFERPEIQKMLKEANAALEGQPIQIAYVKSTDYTGLIQIDMPNWYTKELSEIQEPNQKNQKSGGWFKSMHEAISSVGKAYG